MRILHLLLTLCVFGPSTLSSEDLAYSFSPNQEGPLALRIVALSCHGGRSGTGFVVGNQVLTNAHVTKGKECKLYHPTLGQDITEEDTWTPLSFEREDKDLDLALLNGAPWTLSLLPFADPVLGEEIMVVSYTRGLRTLVKGRVNRVEKGEGFLMDINLMRGSSGAVVLNGRSEVVGVVEGYIQEDVSYVMRDSSGMTMTSLDIPVGRYFVGIPASKLHSFLEGGDA